MAPLIVSSDFCRSGGYVSFGETFGHPRACLAELNRCAAVHAADGVDSLPCTCRNRCGAGI